jgi:hypothetical protein
MWREVQSVRVTTAAPLGPAVLQKGDFSSCNK